MDLNLPPNWASGDALYLTAWDPHHRKIFTWSWPIKTASEITHKWLKQSPPAEIKVADKTNELVVKEGKIKFYYNKKTGYLEKVERNDTVLSLSGGPRLAGFDQKLRSFNYKQEGENYIIKANYEGENNWLKVKWTFSPGMPVKLSYSYKQKGDADYMGITFNYPEKEVMGMKWLGRGPYHVWKNRLKGLKFGIWELAYNNTTPGLSWNYPAFKGNRADVYWIKVKTKQFPFTIFMENNDLFFQMLKMKNPKDGGGAIIDYPKGNIGFLNAIQPIGSKFQPSDRLGPQSQTNLSLTAPYEGVLWFDFSY